MFLHVILDARVGKKYEIEVTVAVEIPGNVYAPFHDHRGNVCCLINSASGTLSEFYRYSAFGEEQVYSGDAQTLTESSLNNPWLFASKRLDTHTRLIQFGKRDYDSNLGRWLTPDPLGFADGPNLYAYVQNNPLILFDPWGLISCRLYLHDDYQPHAFQSRSNRMATSSGRAGGFWGCLGLLGGALIGQEANHMANEGAEKLIARTAHDICLHGTQALSSIESGMSHVRGIVESFTPSVLLPKLNMASPSSMASDRIGSQTHQLIDHIFSTNLQHSYTPEAIQWKSQYGPTLGMLPIPGRFLGKNIWSTTSQRTSVENAFSHWVKHKNEFPHLQNAKQFVESAQNLLKSPPTGTLSKIRANGEVLRYHLESNTFAAYTKDGVPKTMFRPMNGIKYWEAQ